MTGSVLSTDPISPIESIFNLGRADTTALQALALSSVADPNSLPSVTGLSLGRITTVTSMQANFQIFGTAWVQVTPAVFASSTARDAEYAKAAGAYLVQGALVRRTDTNWTEQYFALYNSSTNPNGAAVAGWYPVSGTLPYVSGRNVTATSVTGGSWALVNAAWGGTPNDFIGFTYATGAFTCAVAGWYDVQSHVKFPAATTPIGIQVVLNGAVMDTNASFAQKTESGTAQMTDAPGKVKLAVGDVVRMYIFTNTTQTPANLNDIRLDLTYRGPVRF
jgi:hypothetical protein